MVTDNQAILDRILYQVTCRDLDEAHYLLAIINSDTLAQAAKPFCASNWAKKIRHLEKHLWKLPIPEYDPKNEMHAELSRLGQMAARLAGFQLETLTARHGEEWLTDDRVRRDLRDVWLTNSVVAADIENAVQELLNPMVSE